MPWRATVGLRTPLKRASRRVHGHSSENSGNSFISTTVMVRLRISATSLSVLNRFRVGRDSVGRRTSLGRPGQVESVSKLRLQLVCAGHHSRARDEAVYLGILRGLSTVYRAHDPLSQFLTEQEPRPDSMTPAAYQRAIAARAFDVTRYLLPPGGANQCRPGGQHSDARKQITRFLSSQIPELRPDRGGFTGCLSKAARECGGELCGQSAGAGEAMAPDAGAVCETECLSGRGLIVTLARYAKDALKGTGLDQPLPGEPQSRSI